MNFLPLPVRRACWCFDILLLLCCFYRNALASSRVMYVFSFISTNVLIVSFVWLVQLPNACFLVSFNTYFTCSCCSLSLSSSLDSSVVVVVPTLNTFIMSNVCAARRTRNYPVPAYIVRSQMSSTFFRSTGLRFPNVIVASSLGLLIHFFSKLKNIVSVENVCNTTMHPLVYKDIMLIN